MSTVPSTPLVPAENAVRAQFSHPPALEAVARKMLEEAIEQAYPSLKIGGWSLLCPRFWITLEVGQNLI